VETAAVPLARLALALDEALKQARLDGPATQALRGLADQLELVSKDLGAVHLSNLANSPSQAVEPYYFFPIPVNTPAGPQTAQLKVYGQPGQRAINPGNVRLALLLDLPSLGEIAVELTILQRHLSGRILSGRVETHRLVETELPQLRESLSQLGYRIEILSGDLLDKPVSSVQPAKLTAIDVSA
jgi:hypothetical protein